MAENTPRVSPWDTSAPSSFTKDSRFLPVGKQHKSQSQLQTESVAKRTRATGKNPGTIPSLAKDPVGRARHTSAYSRKKAAE